MLHRNIEVALLCTGRQEAKAGGKGQRDPPEFKRPDTEVDNKILLA